MVIKSFRTLILRRKMRADWRIKPYTKLIIDKDDYLFSFIPTIVWQPWRYRYSNTCVIDIHWLIFHLCFGLWEQRKENT